MMFTSPKRNKATPLSRTAIGDASIAEDGLPDSKTVQLFGFPNNRSNTLS
jgi:hypothetical protein